MWYYIFLNEFTNMFSISLVNYDFYESIWIIIIAFYILNLEESKMSLFFAKEHELNGTRGQIFYKQTNYLFLLKASCYVTLLNYHVFFDVFFSRKKVSKKKRKSITYFLDVGKYIMWIKNLTKIWNKWIYSLFL